MHAIKPEDADVPAESEEAQRIGRQLSVDHRVRVCDWVVSKTLKPTIELPSFIGRALAPDEPAYLAVKFHLEAQTRISSLRKATYDRTAKYSRWNPHAMATRRC
ncbi:MAG: hypothetical protein V1790_11920 [Planctomycetota bacterium]